MAPLHRELGETRRLMHRQRAATARLTSRSAWTGSSDSQRTICASLGSCSAGTPRACDPRGRPRVKRRRPRARARPRLAPSRRSPRVRQRKLRHHGPRRHVHRQREDDRGAVDVAEASVFRYVALFPPPGVAAGCSCWVISPTTAFAPSKKRAVTQLLQDLQQLLSCLIARWAQSASPCSECAGAALVAACAWPASVRTA